MSRSISRVALFCCERRTAYGEHSFTVDRVFEKLAALFGIGAPVASRQKRLPHEERERDRHDAGDTRPVPEQQDCVVAAGSGTGEARGYRGESNSSFVPCWVRILQPVESEGNRAHS